MKRRSRDEEREQRITMEIIVDAYTPEEQAMGWYYSLEDRLHFPFVARCIAERSISPLRVGDEVDVVGMAPEEECEHEMFVLIGWDRWTSPYGPDIVAMRPGVMVAGGRGGAGVPTQVAVGSCWWSAAVVGCTRRSSGRSRPVPRRGCDSGVGRRVRL
jgi:Calcium binding